MGIEERKKKIRKRKCKENAQYTVSVLSYIHVARAICLWFVSKYLPETKRHVRALCDSVIKR
jgi:hypothetical protein